MNKQQKIVYYARKQVEHGSAYVWGGQGQLLSKLSVMDLCRMETSASNAQRVIKYCYDNQKRIDDKAKAFDCSGLAIKALIYAGLLPEGYDNTADGLMHKYPQVKYKDRRESDLIFKTDKSGKATHIGIVMNKNAVIEAKSRDTGCVISDIDSSWAVVCRPN